MKRVPRSPVVVAEAAAAADSVVVEAEVVAPVGSATAGKL